MLFMPVNMGGWYEIIMFVCVNEGLSLGVGVMGVGIMGVGVMGIMCYGDYVLWGYVNR